MLHFTYIKLVCLFCASGLTITVGEITQEETTAGPTLSTEGIILECNPEDMIVTIPVTTVYAGDMHGPDVQFELSNHTDCQGTDNDEISAIILKASLTECGTERKENNDTEVYTNRVINSYSDETISRHYVVDIPLECTYNRSKRVSQWYRLTDFIVDKQLKEGGAYKFDFFIYQDENFTDPYTKYPIWLGLDERFYFAASVLSVGKSIQLSIRDCRATPSSEYNDPTVYHIIENHNLLEDGAEIECQHDSRDLVGIAMNTFRFIDEMSDEVYLHCDLLVCDADDKDSVCADQCSTDNARRRRDVSHVAVPPLARKRLTRGPIRVKRSASPNEWSHHLANEDNIMKDNGGAFSPWMVGIAVMATIVTALAASVVMMMKKLNKIAASTQRRECLKEKSVPLVADEE